MTRQYPGYFITLEGGEGCGKTSQIRHLAETLKERGLNVYTTREPGGTPIGEQIREVIVSKQNKEMHPRTEALLFQAARAQIVEQLIRPKLNEGAIVISDRFFDSTVAYQGYGHGQNVAELRKIIDFATDGLTPDLTVFMKVDVEVGLSRKGKTDEWNRLDAFTKDFHERVRAGYLEIIREDPSRWAVIDANKDIETVFEDLKYVVENELALKGLLEGGRKGPER